MTLTSVEKAIKKWLSEVQIKLFIFLFVTLGKESFPGIEKTPNVCGGSACIIRTRIPVWTLISFKKMGMTDDILLESYPTLRKQDLTNAWAYYDANKAEIEKDIKENADEILLY